MDNIQKLLKELTETPGIPGYEGPVRKLIDKYLQPYGEIESDNIGSLICRIDGKTGSPRIMLAGHMDEIGFIVRHITNEGFIHFIPLGGWFDQVLLGQRVTILTSTGEVVGVIGVKPPHLLSKEDREKVVNRKDMYIDIGASSIEEVKEAGIKVGDPVIPRADFVVLHNGKTYLSKAFDNRIGVALLISIAEKLKGKAHPNSLFLTATVQEEVGIRGATTSVEKVNPDAAIILEVDIAGDVPGVKPEESSIKLGGGPSIVFFDARMIPNLKLRNLVLEVAAKNNIPVQTSMLEGGTTDGAAIHLHKYGVPTVIIGVPARHIHSHSSMIHRDDYDRAVDLIASLIMKLDAGVVSSFTSNPNDL